MKIIPFLLHITPSIMATIWIRTPTDDTCVSCTNIIEAYFIGVTLCVNPPSLSSVMNQFSKKSYYMLENQPVQISIYNGTYNPPIYAGFQFGTNKINVSELLVHPLYIKRVNDVRDMKKIKEDMKHFVTQSMHNLL